MLNLNIARQYFNPKSTIQIVAGAVLNIFYFYFFFIIIFWENKAWHFVWLIC